MFPPKKNKEKNLIKRIGKRLLFFNFYKSYDIFISNSCFTNQWLGKRWPKVKRSMVIYPPCFDSADLKGRYDEKQKKNIILSVGRFFVDWHNKRQLEMIQFFMNAKGKTIFETYPTVNRKLSFHKRKGAFKSFLESVENKGDCLRFHGKIRALDDVEFDHCEIISRSGKGNEIIIPCMLEKDDGICNFYFDLSFNDFDEDAFDINSSWSLNIRLKNNEEIIDTDILHSNELGDFKRSQDYNLEYIKSDSADNQSSYILLYSTKGLDLRYDILNEEMFNKHIEKAKNLDKYQNFKESLAIDENMVFFESFHGTYSNNPKYIYEKMLEMGYDEKYTFIWSYSGDDNDKIPGNPIIVNDDEEDYYRYLACSKYRVNNATFSKVLDNRKETVYLQTWHGTPLKRLGKDIDVKNPGVSWNHFNNEVKTWNYLISANAFSSKTFKRAFNYKNRVLEMGYPANDIFYQDNGEKINSIKERYGIPKDRKIILYAPTFRDDKVDDEGNRVFDLELDLERCYNELKDDYFLIIKTHYVVSENLKIDSDMKDFALDLSNHDDIHELFIISDLLITDYSSVFFDYAHTERPVLFFMPDLENYIESRGIYEEIIEELPGPIINDNADLIDNLKNINIVKEEHLKKYNAFYNKYCNTGHGNASESIIEEVFGKLE